MANRAGETQFRGYVTWTNQPTNKAVYTILYSVQFLYVLARNFIVPNLLFFN